MRRVVVTGLGCTTPLGVGIKRTWSRILNAECGVVSLRDPNIYAHSLEQQQCHVAGVVPVQDFKAALQRDLTDDDHRRTSLFMKHALLASAEALRDGAWHPNTAHDQERTGVCMGSGIGSLEVLYDTSIALSQHSAKKVSPFFVPKLLLNLAAGHISMKYSLLGPSHAATTACATGAHSIGDAARFITAGDADVMLAGGAEACIHPLAFAGFERSRSLTTSHNDTPSSASRPFDRARDGFVMGEGAGVLLLEDLQHALARNANIYAELVGYGASSDAYHLTAPPPNGHGAYRAMKLALQHAQIKPREVDYINAHATGTQLGDTAENTAIKALMLDDTPDGKTDAREINVSSTKGALGHMLGAAGAVEALFCVLSVRDNVLAPTLNLASLDKEGGFECNYVPLVKQDARVDVSVSNSFGFGGSNASLCFRRFTG